MNTSPQLIADTLSRNEKSLLLGSSKLNNKHLKASLEAYQNAKDVADFATDKVHNSEVVDYVKSNLALNHQLFKLLSSQIPNVAQPQEALAKILAVYCGICELSSRYESTKACAGNHNSMAFNCFYDIEPETLYDIAYVLKAFQNIVNNDDSSNIDLPLELKQYVRENFTFVKDLLIKFPESIFAQANFDYSKHNGFIFDTSAVLELNAAQSAEHAAKYVISAISSINAHDYKQVSDSLQDSNFITYDDIIFRMHAVIFNLFAQPQTFDCIARILNPQLSNVLCANIFVKNEHNLVTKFLSDTSDALCDKISDDELRAALNYIHHSTALAYQQNADIGSLIIDALNSDISAELKDEIRLRLCGFVQAWLIMGYNFKRFRLDYPNADEIIEQESKLGGIVNDEVTSHVFAYRIHNAISTISYHLTSSFKELAQYVAACLMFYCPLAQSDKDGSIENILSYDIAAALGNALFVLDLPQDQNIFISQEDTYHKCNLQVWHTLVSGLAKDHCSSNDA